jgi:F0F1-type ATP synthase epsilon subunit
VADDTTAQAEPQATEVTEQPTGTVGGKPVIQVKVYAPFKIYFEGEAFSVSAVNAVGPFDVLPKHHNFLCMLVPCELKLVTPDGPKSIKISRALMQVSANKVVVFVDV